MRDSENLDNSRTEFFVVALPGLEDLVLAEIAEWFPDFTAKAEHGGITVFAPLNEGLAMNLVLKTATRVLIRLARFRCKDFPKLFNKIAHFPWEQWIDPACELKVHPSTRLSRLKIKSRIVDACEDGWMEHLEKSGLKAKRGRVANLYVRFLEDECTLSLDSSGERLHKRGQREFVGEAPLRETIAAALIQLVERKSEDPRPVEIVDPMMGSGTFLLEAAIRDQMIEKRDFAFETFNCAAVPTPRLRTTRPHVHALIGYELDKKTISAAKENLRDARLEGGKVAEILNGDFLEAQPLPKTEAQRWLFCNPPYGERLKVKEPLADLYAKLFAAAEKVVHPDLACFLLPSKAVKGKFVLPPNWKVLEKRPFLNGGIPVTAFVFKCLR
ncbi:MAG: hypothetical protein KF799_05005 [Bdellovibrionales bacterium]|nr:hypothetical protein [Bdellovibrionales bacterium]